jgi:L-iditol 2-dehydrogenase
MNESPRRAASKAVSSGAARVIVIGGPSDRLDLAAKWGASSCIDIAEAASAGERVAAVMDLTDGRGADVVAEMSGVVSAFGEGMSMLAPGGRYLIVGQAHTQTLPFNPSEIMFRQATLIGSLSAGVSHYWRALQFLSQHAGRFRWQDMLSSPRRLDQVNEAFDAMASWREIKPVIQFS